MAGRSRIGAEWRRASAYPERRGREGRSSLLRVGRAGIRLSAGDHLRPRRSVLGPVPRATHVPPRRLSAGRRRSMPHSPRHLLPVWLDRHFFTRQETCLRRPDVRASPTFHSSHGLRTDTRTEGYMRRSGNEDKLTGTRRPCQGCRRIHPHALSSAHLHVSGRFDCRLRSNIVNRRRPPPGQRPGVAVSAAVSGWPCCWRWPQARACSASVTRFWRAPPCSAAPQWSCG